MSLTNPDTTVLDVLSRVSLFEGLSAEELRRLAQRFQVKRFRRQSLFLYDDDHEGSFFVVAQGRVKISRLTDAGSEMTLAIMGAGDSFGELSAVDGRVFNANVTLLGDVELYVMSHSDFTEVLKTYPHVSMALIQQLTARLRFSDWRIHNLSTRSAQARVAASLIHVAEETGMTHLGSVTIPHLPYHKDLANIAGTSRETVSRSLKAFKARGDCSQEGKAFVIHDIQNFKRKHLGQE